MQKSERFFSVGLHSKAEPKTLALPSGLGGAVLVDGNLAELLQVKVIEDAFLEVTGKGAPCEGTLSRGELRAGGEKGGST